MALPLNALSASSVPARFSGARSGATAKTVDYEDGGLAIQDPSKGLLYQRWRARLFNSGELDSYVMLDARDVPEFIWLAVPFMSEISFSFDANMQPVIAYVANGLSYLNWFDGLEAKYVTTALSSDVITPRVSLDDKRYQASDRYLLSDVILGYVRGTTLYYRQQRDRYAIERVLATGVKPLIRIGMNRGLRFQFMCEA